MAFELVLQVAYYGRREVLDAFLAKGLVKRLLRLQRSDDLSGASDSKGGVRVRGWRCRWRWGGCWGR